MATATKKRTDAQTARIYVALKSAFPGLSEDESDVVYKYNRYSIRVRVISEAFESKSLAERETQLNRILGALSEEDRENITMLMMLTPEEAEDPIFLNHEFDNPGSGRL